MRQLFLFLSVLAWNSSALAASDNPDFQLKYFDLTEGRVAFSYVSGENRDIYVLDFKDLGVQPIVSTQGADEAPNWSPDGTQLVFHSDVTGDKEIYLVKYDGSDLMRLTNSKGADENPHFSPDGKKIVFQSSRRVPGSEIFIMDVDGANQTVLVSNAEAQPDVKNVTPRVSPRNDEVLYVTNAQWPGWDIQIYNLKSKEIRSLSQGLGSYIRPSWKSDGGSFAFSYGTGNELDIWVAEKGKTTPMPFIRRDGRDLDPVWTDDSKLMFFAGEMVAGQGDFQLFLHDSSPTKSGKESTLQVLISKGSVRHPAWTPFPTVSSLTADIKRKHRGSAAPATTAP